MALFIENRSVGEGVFYFCCEIDRVVQLSQTLQNEKIKTIGIQTLLYPFAK